VSDLIRRILARSYSLSRMVKMLEAKVVERREEKTSEEEGEKFEHFLEIFSG
jgi:hypothetical protein